MTHNLRPGGYIAIQLDSGTWKTLTVDRVTPKGMIVTTCGAKFRPDLTSVAKDFMGCRTQAHLFTDEIAREITKQNLIRKIRNTKLESLPISALFQISNIINENRA